MSWRWEALYLQTIANLLLYCHFVFYKFYYEELSLFFILTSWIGFFFFASLASFNWYLLILFIFLSNKWFLNSWCLHVFHAFQCYWCPWWMIFIVSFSVCLSLKLMQFFPSLLWLKDQTMILMLYIFHQISFWALLLMYLNYFW